MKQIILGTLIAAFTATAGMAHHPFEGSNGGTREVTSGFSEYKRWLPHGCRHCLLRMDGVPYRLLL